MTYEEFPRYDDGVRKLLSTVGGVYRAKAVINSISMIDVPQRTVASAAVGYSIREPGRDGCSLYRRLLWRRGK